ncbi:MAG: hypothetical protein PWP28_2521 [Oceanotoga sp.]|uniref:hypothetical protein n=1 Tax=Oceanotoga sp. TaxID=2108366 RepID=UPI0026503B6E|nr:hypothetical protein [Oceanotoga sp.]MDN5343641.1 hypothetical protein [Oceanotoga sp.]
MKDKPKYIKVSDLKNLFEKNFFPLIISVYAEKYESKYETSFAISAFHRNFFSFKEKNLYEFNKKYFDLPGSIGPYYFIDVPEKLTYQFFS